MEQYRLTMRGISKTYGNAAALQDVDFRSNLARFMP
jgi:ribose transport system ATP-binding protein